MNVVLGKIKASSRRNAKLFSLSSWSLRTRVLVVTVLTVLLGFFVTISVLTWQATQAQEASALLYAQQLAETNAGVVESQLTAANRSARQLADMFAAQRSQGGASRQVSMDFIRRIAEANPEYLAVWTVWEPNAFDGRDAEFVHTTATDGSGRFVPTWGRYSGSLTLESAVGYDTNTAASDWYREPKRVGHDVITEPSSFTLDGKDVLLSSISVPMFERGKFLGVTGIDVALPKIQTELERIHPFGSGFVSLVSQSGKFIANGGGGEQAKVLSSLSNAEELAAVRSGSRYVTTSALENGETALRIFVPIPIGWTNAFWSLVVTVPEREVLADVVRQRHLAAALGVMSVLAVSVLLGFCINRSVIRPMGGEPEVARTIASQVATGDLTSAVSLARGDNSSLMAAMSAMQESLRRIVATVRVNAEHVANASTEIAQGNQDLSDRTSEQAASLEQASASMEEFAATIQENSSNAHEANTLASAAATVAKRGGGAVEQVVTTMRRISDSSKEITDIVSLIEAIAFQTNILALNAAVEAARAGQHGNGFAVVAEEVRNLAQRSASASKEIRALVARNQKLVDNGAEIADDAGSTMDDVVQKVQQVAEIISEISVASKEQQKGVTQLGEVVRLIDHNTQQNAALVEQSAAATEGLRNQAHELVKLVSTFKTPA